MLPASRRFFSALSRPSRVNSICDLIGFTPVVRLNRVVPPSSAAVFVKMESLNPGGSVKDRIALAMVADAERSGALRPGMRLVEATSGNTGVGLAFVAAARGYPITLVRCAPAAPAPQLALLSHPAATLARARR